MSRSALLVGLLALGVAGLSPSIAAATPDQTVLVTRGFDGRPGNGVDLPYADSVAPYISADGQRIAFTSGAANLWPSSLAPQQRAFLRDLRSTPFVLVSRADGLDGAPSDDGGHPAAFDAAATSITPDGSRVDFMAELPGPFFGGNYGWRRDVDTGTTTLITADEHGVPVWSRGVLFAAGGNRYVLFQADDSVLDGLGRVVGGIYLRDLQTGKITLVSRATGRNGTPVGAVLTGVSPGGRYVTFRSSDSTLAGGPPVRDIPYAAAFVYLRDLRLGQTILVSRANGRLGTPVASRAYGPTPVTGDGCRVAFDTTGVGLADGSPSTGSSEVYVRDVCQGTTTLVSRANGANGDPAATPTPGPYTSSDAVTQAMSADGRYVLFGTAALNLADGLRLGQEEVYLRDLEGHRTLLVSRADGPDGRPADPGAASGSMTPDARFVTFTTRDPGFTPDGNTWIQVYRRELASVPPAATPPLTCGPIDDPGLGGDPVPPCPGDGGTGDGSGTGTDTTTPPADPKPVTVTVPGTPPAAGTDSTATTTPPAAAPATGATVPTLVRAPTLSAITATSKAVRAWVDLPATVQVVVARQDGRRWRTQRTVKLVVKKAGRVTVKLPKLSHRRYRLTIRALGASGTTSPAIVRTVDLRPRKAKKQ
ncbi:MAG TPA: hypothetical protein VFG42_14855 [Baekduia sp.]|uniref:hypothetical protein n=1 Tax=Baekduia sp. TaxID=2600305 RepID=UPI002D79CB68|nr:hypothetical protein [Baekduia sp.]HET6508068.1 hypothetical protein [Baekduia sp.]